MATNFRWWEISTVKSELRLQQGVLPNEHINAGAWGVWNAALSQCSKGLIIMHEISLSLN